MGWPEHVLKRMDHLRNRRLDVQVVQTQLVVQKPQSRTQCLRMLRAECALVHVERVAQHCARLFELPQFGQIFSANQQHDRQKRGRESRQFRARLQCRRKMQLTGIGFLLVAGVETQRDVRTISSTQVREPAPEIVLP